MAYEAPYCSSCHELLQEDRHESYFNRPLCDECSFDLAIERGEN